MNDRIASESGGLSALVLEDRPGKTLFVKPVVTHIDGDPPFPRREGMGGARYLRHCLESAFLDQCTMWPAGVIQRSGDVLQRIDGAAMWLSEPEFRTYRAISDTEVKPTGRRAWTAVADMPLIVDGDKELPIDYADRFAEQANDAQSDLESAAFAYLWQEQSERLLAEYRAGKAGVGAALTGLLGRQAWLERQFFAVVHKGDHAAWPLLYELVSARYIRALCLLHRCEVTKWHQEILWPEISELGRTILLLSCCGWLKEANELAHRARHMIGSHQNQFVPLVPWFGIVWGTQNPEILAHGAVSKFHRPTYDDVEWVLRNWKGDDLDGLVERLARIADRRRWMMGQFDDEYHIDFDDGFSWTVPYEVGAVLMARKAQGLAVPTVDHPIFELPTAQFELAKGPVSQYLDIYARFIRAP